MELAGIEMRVKIVEKRTRENEKKWKVSKVMQKGVEAFFVISSSAFRLPSQILYSHKMGGVSRLYILPMFLEIRIRCQPAVRVRSINTRTSLREHVSSHGRREQRPCQHPARLQSCLEAAGSGHELSTTGCLRP